jgi:hypothetical protein
MLPNEVRSLQKYSLGTVVASDLTRNEPIQILPDNSCPTLQARQATEIWFGSSIA